MSTLSTSDDKISLKERILREMTIDYKQILEKNFDNLKRLIRLTKQGNVQILVKSEITGKEEILLYLIGKLYSFEAGLSDTKEVENKELMEALKIPEGSFWPWLKSLRDEKLVNQTKKERKMCQSIVMSEIEPILTEILKKVKKKGE